MISGVAFWVLSGAFILESATEVQSMQERYRAPRPYQDPAQYQPHRDVIAEVIANDRCNERKSFLKTLGCFNHEGTTLCKQALLSYVQLPEEEKTECNLIRGSGCRKLNADSRLPASPNSPYRCSFRVGTYDANSRTTTYQWKPLKMCFGGHLRAVQDSQNRMVP